MSYPSYFQANELARTYRKHIMALFQAMSGENRKLRLLIRFCHWYSNGESSEYRLWGGFRSVLDTVQISSAKCESPPPTLIFGLHSPEQLEKFPDETKALKWPGVQYLRYDVDDIELVKAVKNCLQGSTEPVPECLFATVKDIKRLSSEIRHWLEGRQKNTNGSLYDFEAAERGEIRLHPNHLDPVLAISSEHQAMLERFEALEPHILRLAPEAGELKTFSAAIENFQSHWQELETAKESLRNTPSTDFSGPAVSQMIKVLERVHDALETAIVATQELDNGLTRSSETN